MRHLRLQAKGLCRVPAPGPPTVVGFDAAGEPKLERNTVVGRPGVWLHTSETIARALTAQRLASWEKPPDHLGPLLDAVLGAPSALDAAKRGEAAGIEVVTSGERPMPRRPVRTQEFVRRFGGNPPQVDPAFRVKQVSGLHRCWRIYRWRDGIVSELPTL